MVFKNKLSFIIGGLSLFSLILFLSLYPTGSIELQFGQYQCLLPTDTFLLQWRHSVEKQLWQEEYHRKKTHLLLNKTWLQAFGAGTPDNLPLLKQKKTGFIGFKTQESFKEINWVVSQNMQGTLLYDDKKILLYKWVKDYSAVKINVQKKSFIAQLMSTNCNDYTRE